VSTLTYGDTFSLPSLTIADTGEPVLWMIWDARNVADAGDMYHKRASLSPVQSNGDRLSGETLVKIGRTTRHLSDVGTYHQIEHAGYGLRGGIWSNALTDRMSATLSAEFDALTLDLPAWTVEEYRAALVAAAREYGQSLGYLTGHHSAAPWKKYHQDASAREFLSDALDADTRRAMHAAMVEAFSTHAAERLQVTA
jgi:hypothetical protein